MQEKVKKRWPKAVRIIGKLFLWLFITVFVLFLLILTPPVQNFITGKAVSWLEKKLETKVSVKRLFITLSGKIAVDGVYIEDQSKDTLLAADRLRVNMSFTKLLFGNELSVKSIQLGGTTAKIKRQLPDTTFNFQFIIDAFNTSSTAPKESGSEGSTMPINIRNIELENIRFVYKDIVTGNDVEASLEQFATTIDQLDLDNMRFEIPQTSITGLQTKLLLTTPLDMPEKMEVVKEVATATNESKALKVVLGEIAIQKTTIIYNDSVNALYSSGNIGKLTVRPQLLDLDKSIFDLGSIDLSETSAIVKKGKVNTTPVNFITSSPAQESVADSESSIRLLLRSIDLSNVQLQYDDENAAPQPKGMDYAHLQTTIKELQLKQFIFHADTIQGTIEKAVLKEKSGFELEALQAEFAYTPTEAYLRNLYLKTPGTEIKRDIAIKYASLENLSNDIGNLHINAAITNSKIQVSDILRFVPSLQAQPAFANPVATWYLNGVIAGHVNDLSIQQFQLSGLASTKLDIEGHISGLPDIEKLNANLILHELSSSRNDMLSFIPATSVPSSIALPEKFNLTGKIGGGVQQAQTDLLLTSSMGNATIKGTTQQITHPQQAIYDLTFTTDQFQLGQLLKDTSYGAVTTSFTAKGKGIDMATADATITGAVHSATLNNYTYKDLNINARINQQQVEAIATIDDPNIDLSLTAHTNLSQQHPSLQIALVVDSIKTKELHLTSDAIIYRGNIAADFSVLNPDSLVGKLLITHSLLVQNNERIQLDTVAVTAGANEQEKFIRLQSDFASLDMAGQFQLTQLPDVFTRAINKYYTINDSMGQGEIAAPYDFRLNAMVKDKPITRSLLPGLQKLDNFQVHATFSSENGIAAQTTADEIHINGNQIKGLGIAITTKDSALILNAATQKITSGTTFIMDSTLLTASLANNKVDFDLVIKDAAAKDKYVVGGLVQQEVNGDIALSLKPANLLLNYKTWKLPTDNRITVSNSGIHASNFNLEQNGQQLLLHSLSAEANAPLEIKFADFELSTLTGMVMSDTTMVGGRLNGAATVNDITTSPTFTSDLLIHDISYRKDTIGNLAVKVDNTTSSTTYTTAIALSGRENDLAIKGTYNTAAAALDFVMDIHRLPLKTAETFSGGALRNTKGFLTGKFKVTGSADAPKINGDILFNQAGLNIATLNSYFNIDNEKIIFNDSGIGFNHFEVKDSLGNTLSINGIAATKNFINYNFDLDIRATDFKALGSTKKDNPLFWGDLYFNTNLKVKGTEAAPAIDGRLTVNEKTKMTVVLPQNDPSIIEREGVVVFIDKDAPLNDSLFMLAYDSLNTSSLTGMDVSLNLEIDKGADFTLIIDEGNGDFLNVKGEAQLNTGIDPSGKITMVGTYELDDGAYQLSFNMIRKKFDIQKGSKIVWEGDPTSANVDITARYIASTAPLDLVKGQLDENISTQERNTYLQKLPFDVNLTMTGELLKPQISFDIVLPENKNYGVSNDILTNVRTKLEQLRQSTGDMNKQVFSLLLLNRFVAENPFASSSSGSSNNFIKQSVSKLLTEQLNKLAEDLIEGVDINFGIESSDDYTTGEQQDRTDLNVGISKRLLNDRLTVTVGSNFALEGPQSNQQANNIAGNVAIDYALSSDGRYKLRAYRKNDYQGVIDGFVVETGIGFIITLDYNKFNQIFQNKKKQEALRKQRREKALQDAERKKTSTKTEAEKKELHEQD